MQQTDQEIWAEIRNGEVKALRLLHDRYFFSLCNFADKSLHQLPVSEELVSNCFLRLWEQRKSIEIHQSVKAYLYFMVRNQVVDYIRSDKNRLIATTDEIPEIPTEEEINQHEFYAVLYRAIAKLPDQRRQILELAAFQSMTYKQVAQNLNISVNTVKTQMGRAYQFLKEEIGAKRFFLFLTVCFSEE
ncbi:RNA polymerase sigma-70 factor [Mangrovibacterium lignilyticum]|uniref:RNA polymerase sigma-70 factor n=1 Tax=Mangrovibacterium lignilyticum TaxID=2668052 RepID=UPI0013D837B7|nr:RNA polymerase sigma-70 factor [Mangrovibacterium lignilyticum]